jgi:hypothetical protein
MKRPHPLHYGKEEPRPPGPNTQLLVHIISLIALAAVVALVYWFFWRIG